MAKADYADQVAAALIEQLKQGTAPWTKPWKPGSDRQLPYNASTGLNYKGANSLYLFAVAEKRGYPDHRWMTYVQAQKLGAQVRKGEHSTPIQYWQWSGRVPLTDENGQPKTNEKGERLYQVIQHERPLVRGAAVFNAAQIDGLAPPDPRPVPPIGERHERAANLLTASEAKIREVYGDRAYYSLTTDQITLPDRRQFVTADNAPNLDAFFATALHELGHWTGHPDRLNRDLAHPFGSEPYAREELRAEIASLMLGDELGIGHDPGQHASYVNSWINVLERDPREIFRAATAAQRITTYILDFEKQRETTEETVAEPDGARSAVRMGAPQAAFPEESEANMPASDRRYLAVPYAEKDQARELGARWDRTAKAWWIGSNVDPAPFARWIEGINAVAAPRGADPQQSFAEAITAAGLRLPGAPIMDGTLHRVPVDGDRGAQRSGAYVGYLDGRPAGVIQNFKLGTKTNWKADLDTPLDKEALARLAQDAARHRQERDQAIRAQQVQAATQAVAQLRHAKNVTEHAYLWRKCIGAHGVRVGAPGQTMETTDADGGPKTVRLDGRLMVPIADFEGKIASFQTIDADGTKSFLKGGQIAGGQHLIGDNDPSKPLYIAEGYATGATIHELTGATVSVAFNASNLLPVAEAARAQWPNREIIVAGDNDVELTRKTYPDGRPMSNVGAEKAEAAAKAVGGIAVIAPPGPGDKSADWNDHMQAVGPEQAIRDFREQEAAARIELRVERETDREMALMAFGDNPRDAIRDAARDLVDGEADAAHTPRAEQKAERMEEAEAEL